MKKKIIWLFVSCLVGMALVMASCGEEEEGEEEEVAEEEGEEEEVAEEEEEEEQPTAEKPEYGGSINLIQPTDITIFDASLSIMTAGEATRIVNEDLAGPDWSRGPAGTGEESWKLNNWYPMRHCAGRIAESWEIPEPGTIIFQIRQGVHWALNTESEASRLVGGREVTADDVVFSIGYYPSSPSSFISLVEPQLAATMKATKTGPWEVTVTCLPEEFDVCWLFLTHITPIVPHEVIEKYGNMGDWRNSVGTGPFMLTDYVGGSLVTLVRNPNYWEKNPVGPGKGDQLPYVDRLKYVIVTDVSSQMAAMRTAKADWITDVLWEDAQSLKKTTPEIESLKFLSASTYCIFMRLDKTELPFNDKMVRQALMLGIDNESIRDQLYDGEAELQVWPIVPLEGPDNPYVPLEELPEDVQELYGYDPERAIELLEAAGYGDGLDLTIICDSRPTYVELLSVVKDMWSEINVTLEIQPKEYGVYRGINTAKSYDELILGSGQPLHAWQNMPGIRGFALNTGRIDDPEIEQLFWDTRDYVIWDEPTVAEMQRAVWPYFLEQAYAIPLPEPYKYTMWWPWVKNYHGERGITIMISAGWVKYVWIDQDLKEEMTGKR